VSLVGSSFAVFAAARSWPWWATLPCPSRARKRRSGPGEKYWFVAGRPRRLPARGSSERMVLSARLSFDGWAAWAARRRKSLRWALTAVWVRHGPSIDGRSGPLAIRRSRRGSPPACRDFESAMLVDSSCCWGVPASPHSSLIDRVANVRLGFSGPEPLHLRASGW